MKLITTSIAALMLFTSACAGKNIPILVGQTGVGISEGLIQVSNTAKQLGENKVLSPEVELAIQTKINELAEKARPIPERLRQIDALITGGSDHATVLDNTIGVLTLLSTDLSIVVAGVPLGPPAKALLDLVQATQTTVLKTLAELEKLKGAQQ